MPRTGLRSSAVRALTFTCERSHRRFRVLVNGKTVSLMASALKALVQLVLARGTTVSGFVKIPRATINRLRQALDRAAGAGAGNWLIESGPGSQYRLTMTREDLGSRVTVRPGLWELEDLVLSRDEADLLRRLCGQKGS